MKKVLAIIFLLNSYTLSAQDAGKDSTAFLDSIFNEMDAILDEMMPRKNFLSASIGAGTGFFNFKNPSNETFDSQKKLMVSPTLTFYHKTGFGISAFGYLVKEDKPNFYQAGLTPSYDYIRRGRWATGASYTRYFTKDDLSFYTTPIANEASAYFTYKKSVVQPAIMVSYGWGSRTSYEERREDVLAMRRNRNPRLITVTSEESVRDLSLLLSVRKDFDFMDILTENDMFTITPVLALSSGTQNFGLNTSFSSNSKRLNNFLPGNQYIKDKNGFDMQSASAILRLDYSIKKFFVQSQFLLDYYLHNSPRRVNNAFALIAGVTF